MIATQTRGADAVFVSLLFTSGDQSLQQRARFREVTTQAEESRAFFVQLLRRDVDLCLIICIRGPLVEFLSVSEVAFLAIEIRVGFEYFAPQEPKIIELAQLKRAAKVLFGVLEFASVKMQACHVQVTDRFLRQLFVGLALAKNAFEPAQSLAKISAKARRKRKIVCHEPNVLVVSEFVSEFEGDPELLFRLGPFSLHDQAQAARVRALHERFRSMRHESFGTLD